MKHHTTSLALPLGSSMKTCSRLAVISKITGLALAKPGRSCTFSPAMGAVSTFLGRQGTYGQSGGIRVGLKCESLMLWQICLWRSVKPQKFGPLVKFHRTDGEVWGPRGASKSCNRSRWFNAAWVITRMFRTRTVSTSRRVRRLPGVVGILDGTGHSVQLRYGRQRLFTEHWSTCHHSSD